MFILYANKNQLVVQNREPATSGSVNVYRAQFKFSPDWDGMERIAVFRAGAESRFILLDESNTCEVPWEVLTKPNIPLLAGVYGVRDGEEVLPTIWAGLGTILEGVTIGEDAQPPSPDLWEQRLDAKGDSLEFSGSALSLKSGGKTLSTVVVGGSERRRGGGVTFTPNVSEDGVISWTNDGGLSNPDPVDIKGPPGEQGEPGRNAAINGVNALEIKAGENVSIEQDGDALTISASGGGESCSTEETRIGTWIDGKPIYRKVFVTTTPSTTGSQRFLNSNLLNVDTLVDIRGTMGAGTSTQIAPIQYGASVQTYFVKSSGQLWIILSASGFLNQPIHVILEYTKTTD